MTKTNLRKLATSAQVDLSEETDNGILKRLWPIDQEILSLNDIAEISSI
jgi:hypothetical protein